VIASGGMGCVDDISALTRESSVDGVAIADMLHYRRTTVPDIRAGCRAQSVPVRLVG
jgi:cyclase